MKSSSCASCASVSIAIQQPASLATFASSTLTSWRCALQSISIAFPSLAARVGEEWKSGGRHQEASDRAFDRAVVHAANDMPYSELIAVMDAVAQVKRPYATGPKTLQTTAFDVTFATD